MVAHRSSGSRDGPGGPPPDEPLVDVLATGLDWARERDYAGWDYCDGLSSRLRRAIPGENRWVNLAIQEGVKRAPVNVRPLVGVERRRNFKGAALFAMANANLARLGRDPENVDLDEEARRLCDWLADSACRGYAGYCGANVHPVQHLDGEMGVPNDADVVTTAYAVRALLAADPDRSHRDLARTAADYLVEDMDYRETDEGAVVDYYLHQSDDVVVTNAVALAGRTFLDLHATFGDPRFLDRAEALFDHVASGQHPSGGWTYTDPPSASHLSMDSHHNGFVLESLLWHRRVVGSDRYRETLAEGMEFYRETLFGADGTPYFDESNEYPRDAHTAAQGILTFTYAGEYRAAERVLGWTLEHLYDADEGRFFYRQGRLLTKRFTLMRWCQAWLCFAISEYLAATRDPGATLAEPLVEADDDTDRGRTDEEPSVAPGDDR